MAARRSSQPRWHDGRRLCAQHSRRPRRPTPPASAQGTPPLVRHAAPLTRLQSPVTRRKSQPPPLLLPLWRWDPLHSSRTVPEKNSGGKKPRSPCCRAAAMVAAERAAPSDAIRCPYPRRRALPHKDEYAPAGVLPFRDLGAGSPNEPPRRRRCANYLKGPKDTLPDSPGPSSASVCCSRCICDRLARLESLHAREGAAQPRHRHPVDSCGSALAGRRHGAIALRRASAAAGTIGFERLQLFLAQNYAPHTLALPSLLCPALNRASLSGAGKHDACVAADAEGAPAAAALDGARSGAAAASNRLVVVSELFRLHGHAKRQVGPLHERVQIGNGSAAPAGEASSWLSFSAPRAE